MAAPPTQLPGQVAEQALVRQLRPSHGGQLAKVQVGDVGEPEHEDWRAVHYRLREKQTFILAQQEGGKPNHGTAAAGMTDGTPTSIERPADLTNPPVVPGEI